jgi:hypothetical protein
VPIRFEFDRQLNILFTVAEGLISFEEIQRHLDREGMAQYLGKPEIFDATAASTNLTTREVREIVGRLRTMMGEQPLGPTAIVTEDRVFYGMGRMLSIVSEFEGGPEIGVFQTLREGLDWLASLRPAP